ncbi:type 4 (IV) prepilin-like protein leader peptide processing enzyme PilD [Legionella adelaidensis]|uniref:Prepilin leader peptidase/N-methyltransferase n=2 Tax=Legionella adelaidensis TaxID=45056 RepID=A0A0W0R483_9GAMM|nr:type 4 (IV) prepilin-like protein leader peptide processing enzyme PilD [Legionella adelaidensis]
MMHAGWGAQCREFLNLPSETPEKINLFYPRSFCPQCKQLIPFWHNIPIVSYLVLRGQCRHCKEPIPFRYLFVELLTLALSLFTIWSFGLTIQTVFVLLFIWILIVITFIDIQHQLLPDSLSISLLWLGLIANAYGLFVPLSNAVLSAAAAYLSLWLFIKLFYLLTGKVGMGNGDFKLFAAFGAWMGWQQLPFIILFSSLLGSIIGIIYLTLSKKSRDTTIPFGPFLCIAGAVALFWGEGIINWYLKLM